VDTRQGQRTVPLHRALVHGVRLRTVSGRDSWSSRSWPPAPVLSLSPSPSPGHPTPDVNTAHCTAALSVFRHRSLDNGHPWLSIVQLHCVAAYPTFFRHRLVPITHSCCTRGHRCVDALMRCLDLEAQGITRPFTSQDILAPRREPGHKATEPLHTHWSPPEPPSP
jgi:hypothetical protein